MKDEMKMYLLDLGILSINIIGFNKVNGKYNSDSDIRLVTYPSNQNFNFSDKIYFYGVQIKLQTLRSGCLRI